MGPHREDPGKGNPFALENYLRDRQEELIQKTDIIYTEPQDRMMHELILDNLRLSSSQPKYIQIRGPMGSKKHQVAQEILDYRKQYFGEGYQVIDGGRTTASPAFSTELNLYLKRAHLIGKEATEKLCREFRTRSPNGSVMITTINRDCFQDWAEYDALPADQPTVKINLSAPCECCGAKEGERTIPLLNARRYGGADGYEGGKEKYGTICEQCLRKGAPYLLTRSPWVQSEFEPLMWKWWKFDRYSSHHPEDASANYSRVGMHAKCLEEVLVPSDISSQATLRKVLMAGTKTEAKGQVIGVFGPMGARKTTFMKAFSQIKHESADYRILNFKHASDRRYGEGIVTHDNDQEDAIVFRDITEISAPREVLQGLEQRGLTDLKKTIINIDEAHFYPAQELMDICTKISERGAEVVLTAIDMDVFNLWDKTEILKQCEEKNARIIRLASRCDICTETTAQYSVPMHAPIHYTKYGIVGGFEKYFPACRACLKNIQSRMDGPIILNRKGKQQPAGYTGRVENYKHLTQR